MGIFDYQSGNSWGILIHVFGMSPDTFSIHVSIKVPADFEFWYRKIPTIIPSEYKPP